MAQDSNVVRGAARSSPGVTINGSQGAKERILAGRPIAAAFRGRCTSGLGIGLSRLELLTAGGTVLLIALGVARLVPAYSSSSQTYDEPCHIACGMEWLDKGVYTYETQHPPLARVAAALGPYLAGRRIDPLAAERVKNGPFHISRTEQELGWDEGNAILYSDGHYWRNLTLARLGSVPFLVLACIGIVLWARRWFSTGAGMWGLLLFVSLPPVLGVAGQAMTDMACTATVFLALYEFLRWLEDGRTRRSAILGAALGLALLSKFSSIPFLGACCGVALVYLAWVAGRGWRSGLHGCWRRLAVVAGVALVLTWAGYRFSFHPISAEPGYAKTLAKVSETSPRAGHALDRIGRIPLPMPELAHGIYMVAHHNAAGHDSYLFGQYRTRGWWYFFPVVVAITTPIGFLLLALLGAVAIVSRSDRNRWQCATALFPLTIMAVCMASHLNLGVRHILPIYPLLAILAGHAISVSFRSRAKWVLGPAAVLLAGSVVLSSWMAHPDYIGYFNQLAGSHPERITVEADAGQDVHRLSQVLRSLGAEQAAVRVLSSAEIDKEGIPSISEVPQFRKVSGFVAISDWYYEMGYAQNKSFAWLREYTPIRRVGKTISLYRIPK